MAKAAGSPLPGIIYDGVKRPKQTDAHVCLQNNGNTGFLNYDAGGGFKKMKREIIDHNCVLPALKPIVLPFES